MNDAPEGAEPRPARVIVPYQFHRVSCPNHALREGCTFCAMSIQMSRLRASGGISEDARRFAADPVAEELRAIGRVFGKSPIHLFVADDCVTGSELRAVAEVLESSGLNIRLESIGMFARPDTVTPGFLEQLSAFRRRRIDVELFIGFDFMCRNLHDLTRTRKNFDDYPAVMSGLARAEGVNVVAAFILTHPRMTPEDFRENLHGIMEVASRESFELSLAPFIFVVESEARDKKAVRVAYRGYYIGDAFKKIFGENVSPAIEPFQMPPQGVEETIAAIEDAFRALMGTRRSAPLKPVQEANRQRLSSFLLVVYDHFVSLSATPHRSGDEWSRELRAADMGGPGLAGDLRALFASDGGPSRRFRGFVVRAIAPGRGRNAAEATVVLSSLNPRRKGCLALHVKRRGAGEPYELSAGPFTAEVSARTPPRVRDERDAVREFIAYLASCSLDRKGAGA